MAAAATTSWGGVGAAWAIIGRDILRVRFFFKPSAGRGRCWFGMDFPRLGRAILAGGLLLVAAAVTGCASIEEPVSFSSTPVVPRATAAEEVPDRAPLRKPAVVVPREGRTVAYTPGVGAVPRDWVPGARPRQWRYIVIHHSATDGGNADKFAAGHAAKGWDELGYHFVIGNGAGSRDGLVEVGSRWPKQKWGAHAKTPDNRYNDYGIGICLVGNFDDGRPTPRQLAALNKLTAYLMARYDIPEHRVIGHNDCKPTACPGRHLDVADVRRAAAARLATSAKPADDAVALSE